VTLSTYRNSPFWKAAIDLGPSLARLADELPASEEFGLSKTLREFGVDLPAAIAVDLMMAPTSTTRYTVTLKLAAALELVDRIYPALDTASVRASADALAEQLFDDSFGVAAVAPAAATAAPTLAPAATALVPADVPAAAPVVAAPVSVPVVSDAAEPQLASPLGATPAPVAVMPTQESHVQPDSQE
jgi:hypothetical protein